MLQRTAKEPEARETGKDSKAKNVPVKNWLSWQARSSDLEERQYWVPQVLAYIESLESQLQDARRMIELLGKAGEQDDELVEKLQSERDRLQEQLQTAQAEAREECARIADDQQQVSGLPLACRVIAMRIRSGEVVAPAPDPESA